MIPYTICAKYAGEGKVPTKKRLTIQTFKDNSGLDYILIEGESQALEFLGKVIIAQAKFKRHCDFDMGPKSAGCAFFKKNSTHGIYVHRLPCLNKPGFKMAKT
jgi:hypothetical protein